MISRARAIAAAAAVAALMLFAAGPARADAADAKRAEFERFIKDYLADHPEAIQEALDLLESRKAAAKAVQDYDGFVAKYMGDGILVARVLETWGHF